MKRILSAIVVLGAAALTSAARAETAADAQKKPLPPVFDPAAIDHSVDPCVDFYQYACGAWQKATPIPPDQQIWWRVSELDEHTRAVLASILEDASAPEGVKTENRRKIGDYYASCLDEAAIDAKGLVPFTPELERIAALTDKKGLAAETARLHLLGAKPLFLFSSAPDYTDATMVIAQADQGGFALPDRDYYLNDEFKGELADYRAHLVRVFGLLGDEAGEAEADAVMRVETALAKAAMGLVERRDPKNVHHKMMLAELTRMTFRRSTGRPTLLWLAPRRSRRWTYRIRASSRASRSPWSSYPLRTGGHICAGLLIHGLVSFAPKAFVDEDFAFFDRRTRGPSGDRGALEALCRCD